MVAVGTIWFVAALLKNWHESIPLTAGLWLGDIWLLPLCFLLAGFPALRVAPLTRIPLAALVLVMVPLELAWLMCLNFDSFGEAGTPANALLVWDSPDAADGDRHGAARDRDRRAARRSRCCCVRRWRSASAPLKRVLAPVLAGAVALAVFSLDYTLDKFGTHSDTLLALALLTLTAVPMIFLAGLLRARLARSNVGELLVDLREPSAPGALRDALARALRDPTLELAYWVPEYEAYADADGEPFALPDDGRVATFVERGGAQVAVIVHDASLRDEPELVGAVAAAAGIALENERLQADLRARLSDLRASRARIVEAGDSARRKLERDLHDGAQQRLVEPLGRAAPGRRQGPGGQPGGEAAGHRPRGAQRIARGAAQHRARHPPGRAQRSRARGRARVAGGARPGAR